MGRFFTRERFGRPQVLAGTLLLIFLAQCAWLVNRSRSVMPEAHEIFRIHEGLGQWRGQWIASTPSVARTQQSVGDEPYDSHHSALWYLIASAPSLLLPRNTANYPYWGWLAHTPYLIFGVLLGASLWYVAPPLWQCWRLHCPDALLLFAGNHPQQCAVVCRARDRRHLGRFWGNLYRDRGCAHFVCAARSRAVELAPDSPARVVTGIGRRLTVFASCRSPGNTGIHALRCSRQANCGCGDLGSSGGHRHTDFVRILFFSCRRVLARNAPRFFSGDFGERIAHAVVL